MPLDPDSRDDPFWGEDSSLPLEEKDIVLKEKKQLSLDSLLFRHWFGSFIAGGCIGMGSTYAAEGNYKAAIGFGVLTALAWTYEKKHNDQILRDYVRLER